MASKGTGKALCGTKVGFQGIFNRSGLFGLYLQAMAGVQG